MDFIPHPSKPPTPSEYAVLALGCAGVMIFVGLIVLGVRFLAGPWSPGAAAALVQLAGWLSGMGLLTSSAYWLIRRLKE